MPPPRQTSSIVHPVFSLYVCRGSASREAALLHFARTAASSSAMQSVPRDDARLSMKANDQKIENSCNISMHCCNSLVAGRACLYPSFTPYSSALLSCCFFSFGSAGLFKASSIEITPSGQPPISLRNKNACGRVTPANCASGYYLQNEPTTMSSSYRSDSGDNRRRIAPMI